MGLYRVTVFGEFTGETVWDTEKSVLIRADSAERAQFLALWDMETIGCANVPMPDGDEKAVLTRLHRVTTTKEG